MGCMLSCRPTSDKFTGIRIVDISGHVEDFVAPVTVSDIIGKAPKHILCSSVHLVAFGSNPLRPDDKLEPGRIYFLLPHAIFRSETSATDLATLMARLSSMARKCKDSPELRRDDRSSGDVGCRVEKFGVGIRAGGGLRPCSWKPQLDPIYEQSSGRSTERETLVGGWRNGG